MMSNLDILLFQQAILDLNEILLLIVIQFAYTDVEIQAMAEG